MEDVKITNDEASISWKMKRRLCGIYKENPYQWEFHDEEGRRQIHQWSQSRQHKFYGINRTYHGFLVYTFNLNTLKNFIQNINFMVVIQMMLAGFSVYVFQYFNTSFDINVSLFVSPIVFPLAFSINADFQRREKVLEDLANFKSAGMFWFYCMREWKETSGLDEDWMNAVHSKLKSLLFHLREYLLTGRVDRRNIILNAMYEDMSDCSQLIEKVRASQLAGNPALVSGLIHLVQMMSLSFERLRVVREYRSPRSIRSFNKVLILFIPFILGPYFVFNSKRSSENSQTWSAYYISILVSFVFSALQGVQDNLDDPFDGMSEDDINLEQIDEWTFQSLQATVNRTFQVGRFHVNIDRRESIIKLPGTVIVVPTLQSNEQTDINGLCSVKNNFPQDSTDFMFDPGQHPYAEVLEKISGDTRIEIGGGVHPAASESSNSSLDSLKTETTSSSGRNTTSVMSLNDKKQTRPMSLKNGIEIENSDCAVLVSKERPKTYSFGGNPKIFVSKNDFSENESDNPNMPLLYDYDIPRNSRFKLTRISVS